MRRASLALMVCTVVSCQEVPDESNMVLLQPYLNKKALGDGVEAYNVGGTLLVPLGEICRLLAFGIRVNADRTAATGFFINPKRLFSLDLNKGSVEVEGRRAPMPKVARMPLDIYVDAKALGDWFPVEVAADLPDSALLLQSKEKLPIQELWDQQNKYGNKPLALYGEDEETTHGEYHPTPYSFLDMPMVDLNLGLGCSSRPSSLTNAENATLGGDLFWMSSDIFANRDTHGSWDNSRATLFREDPYGHILGPLHAKRIEIGDLFTSPAMDLVGSLPQGRGFDLDNFPVAYRTRFASKTFRGSLASGWAVEMFQNGSLVGFQQSRPDGLYEFKDVPLRFGLNTFRLVFHGPLGERLDRSYRLDIAQAQPPPGTFYYGIAGVRPTRATPVLNPASGAPPDDSRPSYMVQASYGLSRTLSVQGGFTELQLQDGPHRYGSLGLRGVWSFLALQLTAAQDNGPQDRPGRACEAILNTGYGYSTLTLRRDEFKNNFQRSSFDSTGLGATGYVLKNATGVDFNWSAAVFKVPLSLSAQLARESYVGGASGTRERFLLSTQAGRVMLSNTLSMTRLPGTTTPMQGTLTATTYADRWSWNASLVYTRTVLNGWGLLAQYNTASSWQYQGAVRGPIGSPGTLGYPGPVQVSAGVSRMTGRFGLGFNVQESSSAYSANLQLQISLGREPRTGKWAADAQSLSGSGAVSAIAFIDSNGDGRFDKGEPLVEGAKFKLGDAEALNQISDPAVAFITRLSRSQAVDVSLDESSLEDPAQKAVVKTMTILPRLGKVAQLEFAITTVGEINGSTRLLRDGKRSELGGLEVELVDSTGTRVRVVRSSYDGFYEFMDLPYGDYLLRVTPAEVARLDILPVERKVQIRAGHNFLDGIDLTIEAAK